MFANFVAFTAALTATATAFDCNGPYFSFYNRNGDLILRFSLAKRAPIFTPLMVATV